MAFAHLKRTGADGVKREKKKKRRRKREITYTAKALEYLIKQKCTLETLKEAGDITATQLLIDLDLAVYQARPTEIQAHAIENVWEKGYTLREVGAELGVTPQAVYYNLKLFRNKLAKVAERWNENGRRFTT